MNRQGEWPDVNRWHQRRAAPGGCTRMQILTQRDKACQKPLAFGGKQKTAPHCLGKGRTKRLPGAENREQGGKCESKRKRISLLPQMRGQDENQGIARNGSPALPPVLPVVQAGKHRGLSKTSQSLAPELPRKGKFRRPFYSGRNIWGAMARGGQGFRLIPYLYDGQKG